MPERFHRELLNFLARHVRDRDTAADLAQESYVRVLAAQQAGQSISDPRALLFHTARNLVVDRHRRDQVRRHENLAELAEADQAMAAQHLQPDEILSYQQHAQVMVAAIESLPPRCREAFVLNRFEGLSHQKVADRMGISKNMVAQHVVRGVLVCKACEDRFAAGVRHASEPKKKLR